MSAWTNVKPSQAVFPRVAPDEHSRSATQVGSDWSASMNPAQPPARGAQSTGGLADVYDAAVQLLEALDGAFISSWQSTAAWSKQQEQLRAAITKAGAAT